MKVVYIIELTIAAILFLIMIIAMFTRKTKRLKIALTVILLDLCIVGYVGYSYMQEEPIMTLKGQPIVQLEVNQKYEELGAQVQYHEKDVSNDVKVTGEVDTQKPGEYTIEYQYFYGRDKVKEIERTVN